MAGSSNGNIHMATIVNNDNARYASRSTTPLSTRQSHIVTKGSHEWLIEDFTKREETTGTSLSTRFTTPCIDGKGTNHETVWRLKAYPKGCDSDHRDYISIFINQVSGPVVWVKYTISLLGCHAYDRTPYVHNTRKGAVQFLADRRTSSRGWKKFISLESVTSPATSLLHDGGLMIRCSVELESRDDRLTNFSGNHPIARMPDASNMLSLPGTSSNLNQNHVLGSRDEPVELESNESEFLYNDSYMGVSNSITALPTKPNLRSFIFDPSAQQFLDSMKYTDLTLSVESPSISHPVEIKCHKFMLAKKSDVFEAMFSHDCQEKTQNVVVIRDLEPDIVFEMVKFIYSTQSIQHYYSNQKPNAVKTNMQLLIAADKYNIEDLKQFSEKSLCDSLTVENVVCIVLLAANRFAANLKNHAIRFIAHNVPAVTHQEEWKKIDSGLMTDILRAVYQLQKLEVIMLN